MKDLFLIMIFFLSIYSTLAIATTTKKPTIQVVWGEINNVFDVLPLASIVDDKIFCVHGGIPSNQDNLLDAIAQHKSSI
jgi:diadenosine tetraphosphatase ApaH/serine/threonine PP2A family protein phosphatase